MRRGGESGCLRVVTGVRRSYSRMNRAEQTEREREANQSGCVELDDMQGRCSRSVFLLQLEVKGHSAAMQERCGGRVGAGEGYEGLSSIEAFACRLKQA